jgi:hypothetical protein
VVSAKLLVKNCQMAKKKFGFGEKSGDIWSLISPELISPYNKNCQITNPCRPLVARILEGP